MLYEHCQYHRGSIYCLAWLGDALLASGSNDKTLSLLACSTNNSSSEFKYEILKPALLHKGTIRDLLFTSDGLLAYGGGVVHEIKVTDIQTFQNVASLAGHTDQILALGLLPGGLLASGGQDGMVLLWDMRSRSPVSTLWLDSAVGSLTCCNQLLVTSHLDGKCAVHDLNTFKCLAEYAPHSKECRTIRFHPKRRATSSWVLSGSYDKMVCLTDMHTLKWKKLCEHEDKVIQCRWHPNGTMFASTGADRKACFWNIQ